MAKKEKKIEIKQGLAEWMGTYGDMVTLLLCFFVLMFASSTQDAEKFAQIAASFSNSKITISAAQTAGMLEALGDGIVEMPKAEGNSDKEFEEKAKEELEELSENFKTYFAENNLGKEINIEKNDTYITLNFKDGILFESGSSDLKPQALDILSKVGDELLKYPDNNIKIEGHTDNRPINTARYPNNWYLSAARAISVAVDFIQNKGFPPDIISTEGYGEYRPKVSNDTPENRAINRRVEIKIISKYYDSEL